MGRSLAHLSDLHFGALDAPVAEALVPYVKSLAPDLLVVSGDFTQRARPDQFADAMAYCARFGLPQLSIPGNHDVPLYAFWERLASPFRRYRHGVSRDLSPIYEDDELLVIGVTTARAFVPVRDGFWKDGRISPRQLAQLTARAAAVPHKACVVVTHHPFIPAPGTRRGGVVLGGRRVLPLLADSTVDVLLAGHLHASYHGEIVTELPGPGETHSVLSIQAGTATSHRRRTRPDGSEYPNAFNLLRLTRLELQLDVHSHRDGRWSLESTRTFHRTTGRWLEQK